MASWIEPSWHYLGRLKTLESFALKLETGRFDFAESLTDIFACTIVVERSERIKDAEALVSTRFVVRERKPNPPSRTPHRASCFDFNDVRIYASLKLDPSLPPTGFEHLVFEIQIKTFLQHAWSIATHDLIYKSDTLDWESSRVAYQVKAMLEHAEASITAVKAIASANSLARSDSETERLQGVMDWLRRNWQSELLPADLVRLAQNVSNLMMTLNVRVDDLQEWLHEASAKGEGVHTLNLSPFGAIVAAVVRSKNGLQALRKAASNNRKKKTKPILIPHEIDFPQDNEEVEKLLLRIA